MNCVNVGRRNGDNQPSYIQVCIIRMILEKILDKPDIVYILYYMNTISNLEASVLGLLCERPMHPYEIEKLVEERDMRYWTEISMSSIYKVLRKLEKEGMAKSKMTLSSNNVAKKIYAVTAKGRKKMKEKIKVLLTEWYKPIWPIDLAMSNLELLDREEVSQCFEKYIGSITKAIQCYTELRRFLEGHCEVQGVALARRPLFLLEAEKQWAENFLQEYERAFEKEKKS